MIYRIKCQKCGVEWDSVFPPTGDELCPPCKLDTFRYMSLEEYEQWNNELDKRNRSDADDLLTEYSI